MKTKIALFITFFALIFNYSQAQQNETITISGKVTDFNGREIDSCVVQILRSDFSIAYETYSDKNGNYELGDVKKGKYLALYAIRPKEYPRRDAVPDEDKRLEYWAWNLIADRDLVINPRYHRLELYGTTAFRIHGGGPGLMVYVRPMSLGKLLKYSKDIYTSKERIDNETDVSISPENFQVKAFVDEKPAHINLIQPIKEFAGKDETPVIGYLLHLEMNKKPERACIIIRLEGTNLELNEKGESICFYEISNYE